MKLNLRFAPSIAAWLVIAALGASPAFGVGDVLPVHRPLADLDARTGSVAPSPDAVALADSLGATVRWNRFGTPQVMFREGGFLASGLSGDPEVAARSFLDQNRALFRLSPAAVDDLVLVRESTLADSDAHVLLFGQTAGALPVAHEGRIKVGVVDGQVFWVASSAVGEVADPGAPTLSATEAWLAAASAIGLPVSVTDVALDGSDLSWTLLDVAGLSHPQRVRPVALALPGQGAVPAFETIVLNDQGGDSLAYTSYVHGVTGDVLVRVNRTWRLAGDALTPEAHFFEGSYSEAPDPPACGPKHGPYTVTAGSGYVRVVVAASAVVVSNDIFINVYRGETLVAQGDLGTSPETATYEPGGELPAGDYFVEVCPFEPPPAPPVPPYTYSGALLFESTEVPETNPIPRWALFPASPPLDLSSTDTRIVGCWFDDVGCDTELENLAARAPWDHDFTTNAATFTTTGNAALSAESWLSPLTPSVPYRPVSATRDYRFPWTNAWQTSGCDPTVLTHSGGLLSDNDIDAAVANLFAQHNRMHDWSYFLGFTERNGNAQFKNLGATGIDRENDPEVGNAQAGAVTGGAPSYQGRDNANQITLNDGIAPITNMYLWQPIGGAAYPPCVDGDFDMSVIAHEYGHMIQNRMVDPDNGLGGAQGRSMGESWSDLTAAELLNGQGLVPIAGENPFAVGPYVTGDLERGIRNFGMNASPLNFGNLDYDPVGTQSASPHSNGEVWSAVNFDLRQALARKYDAAFPSSDGVLQDRCASGELPADRCPGNRRWIQVMHDAFLLMPSTPTMLDARDAYLAADLARSASPSLDWPSNRIELWQSFARRGFGADASTSGPADVSPTPSFRSPISDVARVTFQLTAREGGAPVAGEVYVGRFEARATPIADTHGGTDLADTAELLPGTYDFVARADGYGHFRFTETLSAGSTTLHVRMPTNWASSAQGASATGAGANLDRLLDDTESTAWSRDGALPNVDGTRVTVVLNGVQTLRRVQVSAMVEPGMGRFSALRGFEIQTCNAAVANCLLGLNFTTLLVEDAFPGAPFRPLVSTWSLRSFDVPRTRATHVRLIVRSNQCTGEPAYQDSGLDNDPLNETDCRIGNTLVSRQDQSVAAAELQIFSR